MQEDDDIEEQGADEAPEAGPFAEPAGEEPWSAAPERPSQEERVWATVAHVCGIGSTLVVPIIVSLVIYLVKKDESEFVKDQALEALNFQITTLLASIVGWFGIFCLIGIPMLWVIGFIALVFGIVAGIRAFEGERYRYPFSLRPL